MKILKPFLISFLPLLGVLFLAAAVGCNKQAVPEDVSYYTCPMHPQIQREQPGTCPICAMTLVPVTEQRSPEQGDRQDSTNSQGIRIDPRRAQTIGIRTAMVSMKDLKRTHLIQGKVAHDPKLWVAQKEYLIALRLGEPSLIKSTEEKLYFMGLSKDWIRLIKKTRNADLGFHLPSPNHPTFFEAFVNQSDIEEIHPGQKVKIFDLKHRFLENGVVRSLGTMVDLESRTVRALIQADGYLDLKSNTFVQVEISQDLGKRLAVPKSAVLFEGDHNMVYVETAPGYFEGREIELGQSAGNFYEIKNGLKEGEKIVVNGQFLIDSETKMRMGGESDHQH